ncbi:MaoC family dehydratase [Actinomycetospora endophytica]|uniref:MaoC family dehydratase n=1 Tax=Actinomycetospora endophytica TaxID=2291215 RepID=A0ABS8P8N5_9PSEU|nr:MaoC family dehydratase [Actinomycetospora endophytica]MCD2194601.1 MaoC family dehydratase [Actinomycetospora endophytica]
MRTFTGADDLLASVGEQLGPTDWIEIDQARIDQFADATRDHQWIHTDPERAAQGPFGTTIAHGFLTLTMLPELLNSLYTVEGVKMAVNYGLNKVRMPAPVPVGSKVRGVATVSEVTPLDGNAVQVVFSTVIELDGSSKPACVVESIGRFYL